MANSVSLEAQKMDLLPLTQWTPMSFCRMERSSFHNTGVCQGVWNCGNDVIRKSRLQKEFAGLGSKMDPVGTNRQNTLTRWSCSACVMCSMQTQFPKHASHPGERITGPPLQPSRCIAIGATPFNCGLSQTQCMTHSNLKDVKGGTRT